MTINQFQPNPLTLAVARYVKPSHRTRPEQMVGLGLYLLICLAFEWLAGLPVLSYGLWGICLAFSMWTLWRRYSLLTLKIELSVFLSQFVFQVAWSISFFILHEALLSLVALLLLSCNTFLAALLFWKRERLSSALLFFPFAWNLYLVGVNMAICMRLS